MAEMLPANVEQQRMQKNCQGCFYHSGWSCDYILLEKRRRPCRPGDECTVRKKRGLSRSERLAVISREHNRLPPKPAPNPTKKPYTVQVKHPRPVIHQKSVNKKTVFNQTKPPKKPKISERRDPKAPIRLTFEEIFSRCNTPEIIGMYEAGASDAAIGKVVGCCANSVRKWRTETERPTKCRRGVKPGLGLLDPHLEDIKAKLESGVTDYRLAKEYDVSQRTIARFRMAHDLGPARGRRNEHGNEG